MTRLILFDPEQPPCVRDPQRAGRTLCNQPTGGGVAITELQALVWCRNSRCPRCDPMWQHTLRMGRQ